MDIKSLARLMNYYAWLTLWGYSQFPWAYSDEREVQLKVPRPLRLKLTSRLRHQIHQEECTDISAKAVLYWLSEGTDKGSGCWMP
ncbi:hypothetical protein Pint_08419 [Pistacia integerrima]|uniref:Uncharacterized protein n=1 Tax=Pistacia integerrima TaxID=434235 RepID=A0ACC0XTQ1_9ROSI|nr:hypothetical protein Pint_08419 [Pistacia integerrima]